MGGALLGLHILDPIVAIFETIHISVLSGEFFGKAVKGLMDSSLSAAEMERISRAAGQTPGVSAVALVRSRHMGAISHVNIVVDVPGDVMVEEADKIAQQVKANACKALGRAVVAHVKFQGEQTLPFIKPTFRFAESHA